VEGFDRQLADAGCSTWVVCGIETHVCVNQTVHDLIARGHTVHVAADAVSSRAPSNKAAGLEKMAAAGAHVTSAEMALFELLEVAGTDEFKAISKMVR
jgi:nicotinamidase-related amidase